MIVGPPGELVPVGPAPSILAVLAVLAGLALPAPGQRGMSRLGLRPGAPPRPVRWRGAEQPVQGARIVREPEEFEYGEREATVEDLAGHRWQFTQTLRDVAPEEWGGVTVEP